MDPFKTEFTREYLLFRASLSNAQLLNFRAALKNALADGAIAEDRLTIVEIGGAVKFHVFADRARGITWLLGGHWVRRGEPSPAFLERMRHYEHQIRQGKEPHADH